eukprot:TRINITY_DN10306_c0_g1_i1.p1 TRINITY_DN10306_c0_g1~~TRINITY_DN10306_c0_g1_i1.p1  ORF type:complete len:663 (+),score=189.29 TRINITY_DN10306_c0_g1_i1:114-2102(+)
MADWNMAALDAMRAQFEAQAQFHAATGQGPPEPAQGGGLGGFGNGMLGQQKMGGATPLAAVLGQLQSTQSPLGQLQPPPGGGLRPPGLAPGLSKAAPPGLPGLLPPPQMGQLKPPGEAGTLPGGLQGLAGSLPQMPGGMPGGLNSLLSAPGRPPMPQLQIPQVSPQAQQQMERLRQQEAAAAQNARDAAREKEKQEQRARDKAKAREKAEKLKCHLHNKVKNSCKRCKTYQEAIAAIDKEEAEDAKNASAAGKTPTGWEEISRLSGLVELNTQNKYFGLSPMLHSHIVESKHFKELLTMENFEQLLQEMFTYTDGVDPYMQNNVGSTLPSPLFACLYRSFTMNMTIENLRRLVENADSAYIRCAGFLFIRFALPPEHLWPWCAEFLCDTEEFKLNKSTEGETTIGEFVEGLLGEEKYFSTVLPRLPNSVKKNLEAKLAPIPQYRKRTFANLDLLDIYRREDVQVEVNQGGEWVPANTVVLLESMPSRVKCVVRMRDGTEETVPLGRMILADPNFTKADQRQGRGRSRSRSPRGGVDWAREKGRTDEELINEMRNRDRDKAVATGKDYARRPLGFKKACALPREQGKASYRLMEEETFVSDHGRSRRKDSPPREQERQKAPSQEHQQRMQQLFEKYGMQKGASGSSGSKGPDNMDSSTVLRFG